MFVRWLVLAYSVFMQEIYFVVMLRCWQLVTFNSALLCLYDEKEFTILMVKKLLLPWKLLIFTMSCREQSIWGKKKTNTMYLEAVLSLSLNQFLKKKTGMSINLLEASSSKVQIAINTAEQLTFILTASISFSILCFLMLCSN